MSAGLAFWRKDDDSGHFQLRCWRTWALDSAAEAFTYGRADTRANPADKVLVAETCRTF